MSDVPDRFEGGCLCGAVRFVATGQPKWIAWCHCQSCRKHSGAPASVFVVFKRSAYTITQGEITKFDSTREEPAADFCARCGSTFCESAQLPTETHFYVGAFDRVPNFRQRDTSWPTSICLGCTWITERATRQTSCARERHGDSVRGHRA